MHYPLHDATWEPLENLANSMDKLKEFENQWGHWHLRRGECNKLTVRINHIIMINIVWELICKSCSNNLHNM
jgi:hypothetical protein